jgi:hypothetical protein
MDGGAAGNAGSAIFRASSVSGADLLTREAIQNARDAFQSYEKSAGHDPRVSFRFVSLTGESKAAASIILGLSELADRQRSLAIKDGRIGA